MKRIALTLIAVAGLALAACSDGTSDTLSNGGGSGSNDPNGTAGNENTTFDHSNDPGGAAPGADFQPAEPAQVKLVGSQAAFTLQTPSEPETPQCDCRSAASARSAFAAPAACTISASAPHRFSSDHPHRPRHHHVINQLCVVVSC